MGYWPMSANQRRDTWVHKVDGLWVRYLSYRPHLGIMRVELQPTGKAKKGELRDYSNVAAVDFDALARLAERPLLCDRHFARHYRGLPFKLIRAAK